MTQLDAVVLQPFGGPERSEDVVPVLDNVLRGRGVPESRKLEVAEHYRELGGTSPANACNRRFSAHVEAELRRRGRPLRLFLGNRNWHPLLPDTLAQMRDCGVGNAAVFVTSAFSSYSGCRQYQGDRERATATVDDAPALLPTAKFFNHPGFIEANADQVRAAIASLPPGPIPTLVCTAHSIPCVMADSSRLSWSLWVVYPLPLYRPDLSLMLRNTTTDGVFPSRYWRTGGVLFLYARLPIPSSAI